MSPSVFRLLLDLIMAVLLYPVLLYPKVGYDEPMN